MTKAFTMVELIFVIVIIGILASVAIPKLAATRDDAKSMKAQQNLKICILDIGKHYTTTNEESEGTQSDGSDFFSSCKLVKSDGCFLVTGVENSSADGNITTSSGGSNATSQWCLVSTSSANNKNLLRTYVFGGAQIIE